jgi:hypothetical protein
MKTRKVFRWTFYGLVFPTAFAGLLYAFKGVESDATNLDGLWFWIYLILGCWFFIHVVFFGTEFTLKKDFWEDHDRLIEKRRELQEEIDGFLRARNRYIKEWEKINNIWSEFEEKENDRKREG